jgi:(p)ppGpp synthase/HD superfamily hydrolase
MFNSTKIEKALALAINLHKYQKRKGDGVTPYAVHPIGVALLIACHTQDENVLCAALLHDVLEDTDYSPKEIKKEFGRKILKMVKDVSDRRPDDPWDKRKDAYLKHLKKAPKGACLIACADKINNLRSMSAAYKDAGESIWKNFEAPKEKKIKFYEDVCRIVGRRFSHPIQKELIRTLKETKRLIRVTYRY